MHRFSPFIWRFLLVAAALLLCRPALAQRGDTGSITGSTQPLDNDTIPDSPDSIILSGSRTTYSLRGSVKDAVGGMPLSNVRVFLQSLTGPSFGPTYTNDNGNYAFQVVPSGYYTVNCDLQGYLGSSEEVNVADGSAFDVNIAMHKIGEGNAPPPGSSSKISARDLSVPGKARDSMDKASKLFVKADYSGAVKELQRAIAAYPSYYEAYAKMGLTYMNMKDDKDAEPALRKSIELSNQKDVEAYVYLSKLLSNQKKYADATAAARRAVELDSKSPETNLELAIALYGSGQTSEAENYALASARSAPDRAPTVLLLTNIQYSLGNYRGALNDIDTYLRLAPNGPAADQMRAARTKLQKQLADDQTIPEPALTPVQPAAAPAREPDAPTLRK